MRKDRSPLLHLFQSYGELAGAQRSLARKLTFKNGTNRLL